MQTKAKNFGECLRESKRYFLAVFTCFGLLLPLAMRCEIGIAIIKMTEFHKQTITNTSSNASYNVVKVREVAWSNTKVSLIEASFFIGYTLFSLPGGFLTTVFSANLVFGFAVLFSATINLFIPTLVHHNTGFVSVFIARILQGMAEGCLYPSVQSFWRYWAPKQERSKLITISYFGMALGPIIGYPLSGLLTKYYTWKSTFYFWGGLSILWSIAWLLISRKSPTADNCLNINEKVYIEKNTSQIIVKPNEVPWVCILTSIPVWAIIIANIGRNWTYQFSFSGLPRFFSESFSENSVKLGFQMSIPYIVMGILTPLSGIAADCMIKRQYSVTFVRKFFNSLGFTIAGVSFLIIGFVPYLWLTTIIMCFGLGSFGIGLSGFGVNHLDIADIYAGILMGLSNGIGTLAGVLSPIVAMEFVSHYNGKLGWQLFFVVSGLIHLLTVLIYAFLSSGESQPWAVNLTKTDTTPICDNDDYKHDTNDLRRAT